MLVSLDLDGLQDSDDECAMFCFSFSYIVGDCRWQQQRDSADGRSDEERNNQLLRLQPIDRTSSSRVVFDGLG